MNSYAHFHVGVILCRKIKAEYGLHLPLTVFAAANCRPDFSIKYKKLKHYKKDTYAVIRAMLWELAEADRTKINRFFLADRLGVICHYLCDYFCYAHTEKFAGTLRDHMRYEAQLNHYIKKRRHVCETVNLLPSFRFNRSAEDLLAQLDDRLNDYDALESSMGFDMVCAVQACMEVVLQILHIVACKSQLRGRFALKNAGLPAL